MILGTVPYLNVQPLIWALEKGVMGRGRVTLIPEVPRLLARGLKDNRYDSAIVSVFEYFNRPDYYTYVPGPVIAGQNEIYSVLLVSSEPWENLDTVFLDAASLTSINLFRILSAEKGLTLTYVDTASSVPPSILPAATGRVIIGDPAIKEHDKHPFVYDLGAEWRKLTGLSFVFAAWLVPADRKSKGITELLNQSLDYGLKHLEHVANDSAAKFDVSPEFALHYFQNHVHYHLGSDELAGWNRFAELCHKHNLIAQSPQLRAYSETV